MGGGANISASASTPMMSHTTSSTDAIIRRAPSLFWRAPCRTSRLRASRYPGVAASSASIHFRSPVVTSRPALSRAITSQIASSRSCLMATIRFISLPPSLQGLAHAARASSVAAHAVSRSRSRRAFAFGAPMLLPSLPVMFRKRQLAIRWNRHDAYFQKLGALEMNSAFVPARRRFCEVHAA
jgi:hypothetical protein